MSSCTSSKKISNHILQIHLIIMHADFMNWYYL